MLRLTDSCQNKGSTDQYHMTILQAPVMCSCRSHAFLKLTADPILFFPLDRGLKLGYYM